MGRSKYFNKNNIDLSSVISSVENMTIKEATEEIFKVYKNFYSNKENISHKVKDLQKLSDMKKNKALIVNSKDEYEALTSSDVNIELLYFKNGYALINEIRVLLGLDGIDYKILFFDEADPSNPKGYVWQGEIESFMRTRGKSKAGLAHSNNFFLEELSKLEKNTQNTNIGPAFQAYLQILIKKHKENTTKKINYGYAWEAFGNLPNNPPPLDTSDEGRHQIYYNYYRNAHQNNLAWTRGGDIGNTQYKLIRRYKTTKGGYSVSSASVTTEHTIESTLLILNNLLNQSDITKADIMLQLADTFTKTKISSKIEQSVIDELNNILDDIDLNKS